MGSLRKVRAYPGAYETLNSRNGHRRVIAIE
jgi:hypothetical protein